MSLVQTIYLLGVAEKLVSFVNAIFAVMVCVVSIYLILAAIFRAVEGRHLELHTEAPQVTKWCLICLAVSGVLSATLPSKDTLRAMVAVDISREIVNDPSNAEILNQIGQLLQLSIDEAVAKARHR